MLIGSGNGYHLTYQANGANRDLPFLKSALRNLAAKFDTDAVKVDTTVYNAPDILVCRAPRTLGGGYRLLLYRI